MRVPTQSVSVRGRPFSGPKPKQSPPNPRRATPGTAAGAFRSLVLMLVSALCLCACSRLPRLTPLTVAAHTEVGELCRRPYPATPWRAVHAIHITGPFGHESSVIGITAIDPASRRIRAVILSLEGVTLFDASSRDGEISLHRAVPPLDRKGFPEGLMHDISLMFLAPGEDPLQTGRNDETQPVCRWQDRLAGTTDVVFTGRDEWRIRQYDPGATPGREVEAAAHPGAPLAERVRLNCPGVAGYSLDLKLLEVEALAGDDPAFLP